MSDSYFPHEEVVRRVRNVMLHRVGKANAISRQELVRRVFGNDAADNWSNNNRFDRAVRRAIEEIRDTEFVCSSSRTPGYWLADGMHDVEALAGEYVSRSRAMESKARTLRLRGAERFGPQLPLLAGSGQ